MYIISYAVWYKVKNIGLRDSRLVFVLTERSELLGLLTASSPSLGHPSHLSYNSNNKVTSVELLAKQGDLGKNGEQVPLKAGSSRLARGRAGQEVFNNVWHAMWACYSLIRFISKMCKALRGGRTFKR